MTSGKTDVLDLGVGSAYYDGGCWRDGGVCNRGIGRPSGVDRRRR